jgi:hypothetical protein
MHFLFLFNCYNFRAKLILFFANYFILIITQLFVLFYLVCILILSFAHFWFPTLFWDLVYLGFCMNFFVDLLLLRKCNIWFIYFILYFTGQRKY